ncbi:MAG: FHA domain-containing protein [Candidatus Competibacteraceae bacterium]|nr:FHA domain-containing protein [Candidatus Competibacteraceae bacterium]HRY16067.1 FHA domain-containing protein [Candidatus Competibacteraceae bacterium]
MPLYRGFKKDGSSSPNPPVEPTRRIARPEAGNRSRPGGVPATAPVGTTSPAAATINTLSDLVVGWLVVIAGPGRGAVLSLGYGVNDIGRGAGARLCLNFGDETIVSENQAAIIYTMRSRRFYLQSVATGTWLDGHMIRESVELKGNETLQIGQTRLRFVPLCGPSFDWCAGN